MLNFSAVLLAAGSSARMGGENKLLATIGEKPVIRLSAEILLASGASETVIVTGYEPEPVRAALAGLDVRLAHNPDYESGLSSSLKIGVSAISADAEACLIMLGDMPFIKPSLIQKMTAALEANGNALIAIPVRNGERGNPVLWRRSLFASLKSIQGDKGARELFSLHTGDVIEIAADDEIFFDIDTPSDLARGQTVVRD